MNYLKTDKRAHPEQVIRVAPSRGAQIERAKAKSGCTCRFFIFLARLSSWLHRTGFRCGNFTVEQSSNPIPRFVLI
jgi:hypothetical protein